MPNDFEGREISEEEHAQRVAAREARWAAKEGRESAVVEKKEHDVIEHVRDPPERVKEVMPEARHESVEPYTPGPAHHGLGKGPGAAQRIKEWSGRQRAKIDSVEEKLDERRLQRIEKTEKNNVKLSREVKAMETNKALRARKEKAGGGGIGLGMGLDMSPPRGSNGPGFGFGMGGGGLTADMPKGMGMGLSFGDTKGNLDFGMGAPKPQSKKKGKGGTGGGVHIHIHK